MDTTSPDDHTWAADQVDKLIDACEQGAAEAFDTLAWLNDLVSLWHR